MKKIISTIIAASIMTSAAVIPVAAYSNENGTMTWDFETANDTAFKWENVTYDKGQGYKWDKHPDKTADKKSLKPVMGAWQRAGEDSDATRYYPEISKYTDEWVSENSVSGGGYYSVKEMGIPENGGESCIRFGKLDGKDTPSIAMKMYLTDKDVVPGQVYKISFTAAGNKNTYTWDSETGTAVASTAEYSGMRFYTAFQPKTLEFVTNGSSDDSVKKNTKWINGTWTNEANKVYGNITTKPLKDGWNTYEMYISPKAADFRDGVIALWLGAAGSYDSSIGKYPMLPDDFRQVFFDNISVTPVGTKTLSKLVKYGIGWSFEDSENKDVTTVANLLENGKWTSAAEYTNTNYKFMTNEYMIPHYVSVNDVDYRNNAVASDTDTSVIKAAAAPYSTKCAEMYLPAKDSAGQSIAGIGMQTLLSDKQVKAGETYKLTFYAKTNSRTSVIYGKFTNTSKEAPDYNGYICMAPGDKKMKAWFYDDNNAGKAGIAGKSWQRFSVALTPTESDFDADGNIKLWIAARHYGDVWNDETKSVTNLDYGEKLYIDDITLEPVNTPEIKAGETVYFHTDMTNYSGIGESKLFAAVYDDGKLLSCSTVSNADGTHTENSFKVEIPSDAVNPSVKLFTWDKTSLKSLTDVTPVGK